MIVDDFNIITRYTFSRIIKAYFVTSLAKFINPEKGGGESTVCILTMITI